MDYFINGLSIGSIYALVALGYTMVYGIVKLINFAHGDIIMVSSYTILFMTNRMGLPFWLSILISMLLSGILGVVIETIAYKPLRKSSRIDVLITAIGISILLQNVFMLIFSSNPKPFPSILTKQIILGNTTLSENSIVTILVSILLMILLTFFIKYTKIGKAMRAVSEDPGAAALMGINTNITISITFFIGSALAAIGGALFSDAYPSVTPFMGSLFGLKAFIAAVLGGIGILPGAMLGGFCLGIIESFAKASPFGQFTDAICFGVLILVLLYKPSGLLGKHIKEKV